MSQYDFGDLSSPLVGSTFFNVNLEPWRTALHSNHSGSTAPDYAAAGLDWLDTTSASWVVKYFDGTDHIASGTVDTTNNRFVNTPYHEDGSAAAPSISFNSDIDNGFYLSATNTIGISAAGAYRGQISATGMTLYTSTAVASSRLTVGGSISINGSDDNFAAGGNRTFIDFASGYARFGAVNGGGSAVGTKFVVNNSDRMAFESGGNNGVVIGGSITPVYQFQVSRNDTGAIALFCTNNTSGHTGSDGYGLYFDGANARLQNQESGALSMWTGNQTFYSVSSGLVHGFSAGHSTAGTAAYTFSDSTREAVIIGGGADGTAYSSANTILYVRQTGGSGRSINAAGTINASGADYAEYEVLADGIANIAKGDIVGFDKDGLITNIYSDAFSFGVKSTHPNLVGGDTWSESLGEKPQPPNEPEYFDVKIDMKPEKPVFKTEKPELNAGMRGLEKKTYQIKKKQYDDALLQHEKNESAYAADLAKWQQKEAEVIKLKKARQDDYKKQHQEYLAKLELFNTNFEKLRKRVDRIAYCGKTPVNIDSGDVGDYVIAVALDGGKIGGKAVKAPSYDEYLKYCVGQIVAIKDGKRIIKVKIV